MNGGRLLNMIPMTSTDNDDSFWRGAVKANGNYTSSNDEESTFSFHEHKHGGYRSGNKLLNQAVVGSDATA